MKKMLSLTLLLSAGLQLSAQETTIETKEACVTSYQKVLDDVLAISTSKEKRCRLAKITFEDIDDGITSLDLEGHATMTYKYTPTAFTAQVCENPESPDENFLLVVSADFQRNGEHIEEIKRIMNTSKTINTTIETDKFSNTYGCLLNVAWIATEIPVVINLDTFVPKTMLDWNPSNNGYESWFNLDDGHLSEFGFFRSFLMSEDKYLIKSLYEVLE